MTDIITILSKAGRDGNQETFHVKTIGKREGVETQIVTDSWKKI
jgi:hypothetical protein